MSRQKEDGVLEAAGGPVAPSEWARPVPASRVQRQRTKGWRMPPGAVYVGRPSLWGNPWQLRDAPDWIIPGWTGDSLPPAGSARAATREERLAWVVAKYREELTHWDLLSDYSAVVSEARWDSTDAAIRASGAQNMGEYAAVALCGKVLCCWCALELPCHVDVLLELANR